jgi:hypothetical protein
VVRGADDALQPTATKYFIRFCAYLSVITRSYEPTLFICWPIGGKLAANGINAQLDNQLIFGK